MKRGLEDKTVTRGVSRRVRQTNPVQTQAERSTKKPQMTKNNATLLIWSHCRFLPGVHAPKPWKQDYCKYCQYLSLLEKKHDPDCAPRKKKRPRQVCGIYGVHLCNDHFDLFHQP